MYVPESGRRATMTADKPEFLFVGSREVREIPKGWQHPRDASGKYIPLLSYGSDDESASPETTMPPTPWRGETEIVAYEATTEGTPISPPFPNTDEGRLALINYCPDHCFTFGRHKADAEAWAAILFGDAAVAADGRVVAQG
jgi:hypothetical protein